MARRDEKLISCGDFAANYILPTNDNKNMNKIFSLHMNLHKWWNGKIENSFHRFSVMDRDRDRTGHENQNNNLDRYILKMAHYFTAKWKKKLSSFFDVKITRFFGDYFYSNFEVLTKHHFSVQKKKIEWCWGWLQSEISMHRILLWCRIAVVPNV